MIKPYKEGVCKSCKREGKLIGGLCFDGKPWCYQTKQRERYQAKQKGKEPAIKKPIKKFSANKLEALKKYRKLRDKYFEEHPVCEFPGCNSKEITLHHSRGRTGSFLTDVTFFKSLCLDHHRYVEEHPKEAQRMGLSQSRLSTQ